MARIRSIKVDLFMDDGLAEVSLEAHFLLAGLPCIADSAGRLEDRPRRIQAQIFPYRPSVNVDACLEELTASGHIQRYTADGARYLQVGNWGHDQRPHVKEAPSGIPPPPDSTEPRQGSELAGNSPGTRRGESTGIMDLGSGVLGVGSGVSASQASAIAAPAREDLVLSAPPAGKQPRKPSAAERLFATLQRAREDRCAEVGEALVPEIMSEARQNKALGPIAKAGAEEQERFGTGYLLYLADDGQRVREPAWSLAYYLASGVRSRYETRAAREES